MLPCWDVGGRIYEPRVCLVCDDIAVSSLPLTTLNQQCIIASNITHDASDALLSKERQCRLVAIHVQEQLLSTERGGEERRGC